MKNTGIIRRVDDLGRIVIPKEMRNALDIKEGHPMEIHVDTEKRQIVFSAYEHTPNYELMWYELKENKTIAREVFEKIEDRYGVEQ